MNTYPSFYRNGNQCIKRETATVGYLVEIPEPSKIGMVSNIRISMRDKQSFDRYVMSLEVTTREMYDRYLSIYTQYKKRNAASSSSGNVPVVGSTMSYQAH